MSKFEEVVESVATRLGRSTGELSPNTTANENTKLFGAVPWLEILTLLSQVLVPLLQNCNKSNSNRAMVDRFKSPRLLERAALRSRIRQTIDDDSTFFEMRNRVKDIEKSFMEEAAARSEDEINAVVAECCSV